MTTLNFLYRAEDILHQLSREAGSKWQRDKLAELQRELHSAIETLGAPEAWKAQFIPTVQLQSLPGKIVEYLVVNGAGEKTPVVAQKLEDHFGTGYRRAISRANDQMKQGCSMVRICSDHGQVWTALESRSAYNAQKP